MKELPNIGDPITFAGGRYPVQDIYSDTNKGGEVVTLLVIGRTDRYKGFTIPLTATKEFSPETMEELEKAAEEERKRLSKLASAREVARRRMEREAAREAKPMKFRFKMP